MNNEHTMKGLFEGIIFQPGKYGEFSAAATVEQTVAHVDFNTGLFSSEGKRCSLQNTRITIVALVHRMA